MRDPERIPKTLKALEEIWKRHPDLRLGQLLVIAAAKHVGAFRCPEVFYLEDDDLINELESL
jgi:uncharacterized protein YihD (DUF1040 family)